MARSNAEEYQLRAAQCMRLAHTATDFQSNMLHEMARSWVRLAEQATKNSETVLVYEDHFGWSA